MTVSYQAISKNGYWKFQWGEPQKSNVSKGSMNQNSNGGGGFKAKTPLQKGFDYFLEQHTNWILNILRILSRL